MTDTQRTTNSDLHPLRTTSAAALERPPSPLLVPVPYRVIDKIVEIDLTQPDIADESDIVTLHVEPVDGELPDFRPAQVGMLGAFGVGEAAISISTATTNRDYHGYTIRRAGPISGALVDTPIGGTITIRTPFGNPWPIADISTRQLIIIGGGLGIAPLRAVIDEAVDGFERFDRIVLIYGAKKPDLLVYRADLDRWKARGVEVSLIVDDGGDSWDGHVGVVPSLLAAPHVDLDWADTSAFVCGPDVMMHYSAAELENLGVPREQIWLTLERNMQCGNALCGHCQLGPFIVCRDGPVARYDEIARFHPIADL